MKPSLSLIAAAFVFAATAASAGPLDKTECIAGAKPGGFSSFGRTDKGAERGGDRFADRGGDRFADRGAPRGDAPQRLSEGGPSRPMARRTPR